MKIPYGAQLIRYGVTWTPNMPAREAVDGRPLVTQDYALICYLRANNNVSLEGFCGDPPGHCHVINYSDAGPAGDQMGMNSTTGWYITIVEPIASTPATAMWKIQYCASTQVRRVSL